MENILKILGFVIISLLIQLVIATVLIVTGKSKNLNCDNNKLKFDELYIDYSNIPQLKPFKARDGQEIFYREYESNSDKNLILIHGSAWHSQYFMSLAESISKNNVARVFTPDLRGHGKMTETRGDIKYINQYEDDLADFVEVIKNQYPNSKVIIGGHSSGGGLVIRFAGSRYYKEADAYLLLAPFIKYNASTVRKNSGGWAHPYTRRIAGLSMLNTLGIHWLDFLPAIEFNMPKEARDSTETLVYSHRLNTGYAPRNYKKDLARIQVPLIVIAGLEDESFISEQFEPLVTQYTEADVKLIPETTHMGVVTGQEVQGILKKWINAI
ncbi:alpha/beta fold hydrolase [Clostridiaceae bacterium HSG29]|nr:alpha/beta fold hydrolase [Clostridiaceae bacterium HSG29]